MIVVAFYTAEEYRRHSLAMADSADRVGLASKVYERPDLGDWVKNVRQKPDVLRRAMAELKEDVIFVDADARFRLYPGELVNPWCEFAAYYASDRDAWSGTIYLKHAPGWERYIDAWLAAMDKYPDKQDDYRLAEGLHQVKRPQVMRLPPSYNWIERTMRRRFPGAVPVIEHMMIHTRLGW